MYDLILMVNTSKVTNKDDCFGTCGESHQTPFENHSILWVVDFEETLQMLWNAVYDKFLTIWAF